MQRSCMPRTDRTGHFVVSNMLCHVARNDGPEESSDGPAHAANRHGPGESAIRSEYARVSFLDFFNGR